MIAVLAILAMAILVGFVVSSYHGMWKGIFGPLLHRWRHASRKERRRIGGSSAGVAMVIPLTVALVIVAPFGSDTVIFVFGGFGVLLFIWLHVLVIGEARHQSQKSRPKT